MYPKFIVILKLPVSGGRNYVWTVDPIIRGATQRNRIRSSALLITESVF